MKGLCIWLKSENDELPLPLESSLCNQEIITRCDQLICFVFHDSAEILNSRRCAEEMGKEIAYCFLIKQLFPYS